MKRPPPTSPNMSPLHFSAWTTSLLRGKSLKQWMQRSTPSPPASWLLVTAPVESCRCRERSEWTLQCTEWLEQLDVYQGCTRVCCLTSRSPVLRAGQEGTWLMRSLNVNTIQQNWHCSTASLCASPCSCAPASQTEERTHTPLSSIYACIHTCTYTPSGC